VETDVHDIEVALAQAIDEAEVGGVERFHPVAALAQCCSDR